MRAQGQHTTESDVMMMAAIESIVTGMGMADRRFVAKSSEGGRWQERCRGWDEGRVSGWLVGRLAGWSVIRLTYLPLDRKRLARPVVRHLPPTQSHLLRVTLLRVIRNGLGLEQLTHKVRPFASTVVWLPTQCVLQPCARHAAARTSASERISAYARRAEYARRTAAPVSTDRGTDGAARWAGSH